MGDVVVSPVTAGSTVVVALAVVFVAAVVGACVVKSSCSSEDSEDIDSELALKDPLLLSLNSFNSFIVFHVLLPTDKYKHTKQTHEVQESQSPDLEMNDNDLTCTAINYITKLLRKFVGIVVELELFHLATKIRSRAGGLGGCSPIEMFNWPFSGKKPK